MKVTAVKEVMLASWHCYLNKNLNDGRLRHENCKCTIYFSLLFLRFWEYSYYLVGR